MREAVIVSTARTGINPGEVEDVVIGMNCCRSLRRLD